MYCHMISKCISQVLMPAKADIASGAPFLGSAQVNISRLFLHVSSINFRDVVKNKALDALGLTMQLSGFCLQLGKGRLTVVKKCQLCGVRKASYGCVHECCTACCPKVMQPEQDWRDHADSNSFKPTLCKVKNHARPYTRTSQDSSARIAGSTSSSSTGEEMKKSPIKSKCFCAQHGSAPFILSVWPDFTALLYAGGSVRQM